MPTRDEKGREREKKILVPNSLHTRPRQENYEKNRKKFKKIKKPLSGNIFSQNGLRKAEKEREKRYSRIPFILDSGKKIPKKIQNYKKPLSGIIFS